MQPVTCDFMASFHETSEGSLAYFIDEESEAQIGQRHTACHQSFVHSVNN